jgi:hypothetical protein
MKRIAMLIILACLVPANSWAALITVSFEPSSSTVAVGDIFTVDIIADIPDPVLGWGLDAAFDDTIIIPVGAPAIGASWTSGFAPDGDGLVGFAPLGAPVSGNEIPLATLEFQATTVGFSDLLASVTIDDLTEGFPLAPPASPGSFADVTFLSGSVSVVPLPGTILLLGAGLVGLVGTRKKLSNNPNHLVRRGKVRLFSG